MIASSVTRARNHVEFVEWSAEDGTRTEHDFLCRAVETAINAGATTINIPDTVGYTTPEEYRALFEMVRERVPNSDKAIFSVHCHNDLGLAVANSLAGVGAARGRSNARSTASASAPAMRRWKKSSWRCAPAPTFCPSRTGIDTTTADARVEARLGGHLLPGAVQQGDRRPERLRA